MPKTQYPLGLSVFVKYVPDLYVLVNCKQIDVAVVFMGANGVFVCICLPLLSWGNMYN